MTVDLRARLSSIEEQQAAKDKKDAAVAEEERKVQETERRRNIDIWGVDSKKWESDSIFDNIEYGTSVALAPAHGAVAGTCAAAGGILQGVGSVVKPVVGVFSPVFKLVGGIFNGIFGGGNKSSGSTSSGGSSSGGSTKSSDSTGVAENKPVTTKKTVSESTSSPSTSKSSEKKANFGSMAKAASSNGSNKIDGQVATRTNIETMQEEFVLKTYGTEKTSSNRRANVEEYNDATNDVNRLEDEIKNAEAEEKDLQSKLDKSKEVKNAKAKAQAQVKEFGNLVQTYTNELNRVAKNIQGQEALEKDSKLSPEDKANIKKTIGDLRKQSEALTKAIADAKEKQKQAQANADKAVGDDNDAIANKLAEVQAKIQSMKHELTTAKNRQSIAKNNAEKGAETEAENLQGKGDKAILAAANKTDEESEKADKTEAAARGFTSEDVKQIKAEEDIATYGKLDAIPDNQNAEKLVADAKKAQAAAEAKEKAAKEAQTKAEKEKAAAEAKEKAAKEAQTKAEKAKAEAEAREKAAEEAKNKAVAEANDAKKAKAEAQARANAASQSSPSGPSMLTHPEIVTSSNVDYMSLAKDIMNQRPVK